MQRRVRLKQRGKKQTDEDRALSSAIASRRPKRAAADDDADEEQQAEVEADPGQQGQAASTSTTTTTTTTTTATAITATTKKQRKSEAESAHEKEGEDEDEEMEDQFEDEEVPDEELGEVVDCSKEDAEMAEGQEEQDDEDDEDDKSMDMSAMAKSLPRVLRPDEIEPDQELEVEETAYHMLHTFECTWPSLSFDIYRDSLGLERSRFPHTVYLIAGTQADVAKHNSITIMKVSQLHRTKHTDKDPEDSDDDGEEEGKDDDDDVDEEPVMESRTVHHVGTVNRLRSMPQKPHIVASWSDVGKVLVWDLGPWVKSLDVPAGAARLPPVCRPLQSLGHKNEGFSMDWSSAVEGALLTGDCSGSVYLWKPGQEGAGWIAEGPFVGHEGSVEDLQWSPSEQVVFASCSADKTIRIWDARKRGSAMVVTKAHDSDVNVISWNKKTPLVLASGSDDGSFRVWDIRNMQTGPASDFQFHGKAITSIEWSPHNDSALAVSSADNSISIWDLSLEEDHEAASAQPQEGDNDDADKFPPQLMFLHMGQKDIKELHWHPQIPGAIVSTALDGFNIFRPENF